MFGRTERLRYVGYALLAMLVQAGCTTTRPSGLKQFAPPPAPPPPSAFVLESAPPDIGSTGVSRELPPVLRELAGKGLDPSIIPTSIPRAEAHFEAGRRHFRAGQMEAARREFDLAIDALLSGQERLAGNRGDLRRKLTELSDAIHQYDISGLGANVAEAEPAFEISPLEEIPELTFPIDPKLRDQVSEQLKVTASQLPLVVNDDVLRYIDYFTTGRGKKTLLNGLRRSGRFRNMIRRIFDEEGIPQELIHLAQAESGFVPRAVSRKLATGMWQFILSRGQQYGLKRTKLTDDRLDPEKATRAAAQHLRDLYHQFGDWHLAMAAYNCGPICVERAIERTGYADVWELRRRNVLPRETSNYVPIILAMAIIAKSPARYGIEPLEQDAPLEYSTVELEAPVHLALIADITDRSPAEIRELNPALLTAVAPAGYPVHLPAGTGPAVVSALEMIPPAKRTTWRLYRVSEGDTLASIARLHKTTPQQVSAANAQSGDIPEAGAFLVVPAAAKPAAKAPAAKTAAAKPKPTAKAPAARTAAARPAAKAPAAKTAAAKPKPAAPKQSQPAAASTASTQPTSKPAPPGTAMAATTPSGKGSTSLAR